MQARKTTQQTRLKKAGGAIRELKEQTTIKVRINKKIKYPRNFHKLKEIYYHEYICKIFSHLEHIDFIPSC